jgi:hypothetical protein
MELLWGLVIVGLGLFAWLGQTVVAVSPATGSRLGLAERQADVDPLYWADIRGEATWDALSLWTLPLAGLLLVLGQSSWAIAGLVGGGAYAYFAGRGILARVVMLREGHRIGSAASVRAGLAFLAVWLAAALVTIGAAAIELS